MQEKEPGENKGTMENIRMLLVDDEDGFRQTLVKRLEKRGIATEQARDGEECLAVLKTRPTDVVILDMKMPGMDGMETLKEIKRRFPLVEVIMLTGHGTIETAVEGMKLGAFDYLLKPSDFDDLRTKLEAARKRKEDQQERIRKAEARLLLRKAGDV